MQNYKSIHPLQVKKHKYREEQAINRSSYGLKERNINIPMGYISSRNSFESTHTLKWRKQSLAHESSRPILQNKSEKMQSRFKQHFVIGRGGFGRVWKVQLKRNGFIYAMKEMSKALVIAKKSVPSVMNERQLLTKLSHPFIVNIVCAFHTRSTLYLIMDYLPNGDLRERMSQKQKFSEEEAKFVVGCILLGLKYVHEQGIIHRDIKPQNIVLDSDGYARITDFGVARTARPNNSTDTSGTPGYMAPQVLCRQNHSFPVDYFALGVICYELMLRKRPYEGSNRKQIRDNVVAKQAFVKKQEIPQDWSLESADFINRLLQRKASARLGAKGYDEVVNHPWLRNFPLAKIHKKQINAPFKPTMLKVQRLDFGRIQSQNSDLKQLVMQNEMILRNQQVQKLFQGYEWGSIY